jgi:soluble lytic murein transglycosylase-like protein
MTEAARKYNIPLALVRAVAHAESNFDPHALSRKGASGLMQLMPGTASDMYVRDIFDARQNIFGGVRYLRVLANEFDGQMETIVAAYNAGPDAVRKYGNQIPPFEETRTYVQKVLALYFQYKQEGAMTSQVEPASWR